MPSAEEKEVEEEEEEVMVVVEEGRRGLCYLGEHDGSTNTLNSTG
jgi:hypothetical protein